MKQTMWILMVLPFLVLGSMGIYHLIGSYVLSYALAKDRIEVRLLHILPIRWIRFSNIAEIREVRWGDPLGFRTMVGVFLSGAWANRIFVKSFILIRPKKYVFQHIAITPEDPTSFVSQVNKKRDQVLQSNIHC